jgi:hypothetical protein
VCCRQTSALSKTTAPVLGACSSSGRCPRHNCFLDFCILLKELRTTCMRCKDSSQWLQQQLEQSASDLFIIMFAGKPKQKPSKDAAVNKAHFSEGYETRSFGVTTRTATLMESIVSSMKQQQQKKRRGGARRDFWLGVPCPPVPLSTASNIPIRLDLDL